MAALTRSGARKASEIVMLTFRAPQPSRLAMLSVVMDASIASSSSQRRPRRPLLMSTVILQFNVC